MIRFQDGSTAFEGAVLDTREENYHDDSDFYAVVWDGEKVDRRQYATTRGYTYDAGATVDATPEVREAAKAWLARWALARMTARDIARANKVEVGRRVKVVAGRKVPRGTEGVVTRITPMTFSPRYRNGYKTGPDAVGVMLRTDEGVTWKSYERNLEVVRPEQYLTSEEELRTRAAGWAASESYARVTSRLTLM